CVGQGIDVLGGASKVYQRVPGAKPQALQTVDDAVINGFDIVNGDGLGLSQIGNDSLIKFSDDVTLPITLGIGEALQSRQHLTIRQVDEPFNFYVDSVAVQCCL